MHVAHGKRMTAAEFFEWRPSQSGRYELVAGEPVAMAPERVAHVRLKAKIWRALDAALRARATGCEALTDGASVRIDDSTVYEPDALVHWDPALAPDAIEVPSPIIVVEVLSPHSAGRDAGAKLEDYFRLPSVVHYLLVKTERPAVIHHRRQRDGTIATSIHHDGTIALDPPGITLELRELFE